jgi:hypothetical protein
VQHQDSQPQMAAAANALSDQLRFFHWRLEFPQVFEKDGFDVVLGNPPWERIKFEEDEHWADDPYIGEAPNKAIRDRRIESYRASPDAGKKDRVERYDRSRRAADFIDKFIRQAGRFPLTGIGDVNTYAVFTELARNLNNSKGRSGVIVPTGIATDSTYKEFFRDLNVNRNLASLFDFENREGLFPSVDSRMKFSLLTVTREAQKHANVAFFLRATAQIKDEQRRFALRSDELALLNPNTNTSPLFRSKADASLTLKIHRRVPVLCNERTKENPWGIYYMRLVHLGDHAAFLRFNWEPAPEVGDVPLYEAKLLHMFDHRFATYAGATQQDCIGGHPRSLLREERENPEIRIVPRYFVHSELVQQLFEKYPEYSKNWLVVWRELARATDERTCISAIIPKLPASLKCPAVGFFPILNGALLVANLNSLVVDFVTRQKIGSMSLSFFILKQLPVIAPDYYNETDVTYLTPRVVELVYTASDLADFATEMGHTAGPFLWSDERRAVVRSELDAYYAHLYGLTRVELRYILDPKDVFGPDFPSETFRVLKEREEKQYGEYRTRRLVLEAFDKLAESPRFKDDMPKRTSAISESRQAAEVNS